MGLFDEALAKSLETGDTKDLAQVVFPGAESLEKAHIKAHFRLNPKTGKREFIKDYDDARHKDEVHVSFHKGHKVKVNNPKSKHHGKVMEVTGYSEKYDVVRGKIDGEKNSVDFHADHLEHHGDKAAAPDAKEDKEPTGKISAELKAKIDSLSPTEKFTVVNDYLGLRVHAGDKNFRADKDGGTDRFLAHVNVRDFPIKKIEEAVDRMLDQKDRGKVEPPKRDYSKGVTVVVTKVERLPGGQGDRVAFSYDDGTPVEDKIMAGWSHRHGPSSSDPNPAAIRTMSTYKVGEKYKLTRDNRGMWAEPHHTNKVAEGKAPTDTGPKKDLDVKTTPEKLKYDKFGAHVKSGVSSVSDAEKILMEHGFTWDKSDKSGSLGGAIYEKDGKGVAHFDAAGKTLTIYEPKEKSDSKPDQSKATGAQKQWGTEKEIAAPDAGIGPKSFETRFPHIKEFFEQAENTLELGKLKKQAAKFAASNPEGWKWGPIDHFHKEHAETLRQLGRSGHKQTAAAEHRMDTLLRTRDSSGRATARRRS